MGLDKGTMEVGRQVAFSTKAGNQWAEGIRIAVGKELLLSSLLYSN